MNRTIYLLWDKPDNAPPIVRLCIDLWIELNPGWKVEVMDQGKLDSLLAEDYSREVVDTTPVQAKSDMLRAKLLAERGGLWADATCLPILPVESWIEDFADRQFCAVPNRSPGRPCSSWFLLAQKDNLILRTVNDAIKRYWTESKVLIPTNNGDFVAYHDRNWKDFISDKVAHKLRLAPYFWFHYHFAKLLEEDAEFQNAWGQVGWFFNGGYGFIYNRLVKNTVTENEIASFLRRTPLQCNKLNWKRNLNYPLTLMRDTILERRDRLMGT